MESQKDVSIAIVGGTGNLGQALAVRLAAPRIRIIIGSRDPKKARTVVESIRESSGKEGIDGKSNQEAVKEAELVVIAVPYEGHSKMVT
ncbi:MAG: NAD(P)-binding domain-containing protein, partial [Candidatus Binatia bacterium]